MKKPGFRLSSFSPGHPNLLNTNMTAFAAPPILFANLTAWLTPIWLLGAGCLLGLIILAVLYGIVRLIAPRTAEVIVGTLREGFLTPVLSLAGALAGVAVIGLLLSLAGMGFVPLGDITRSLARLPAAGTFTSTYEVQSLPKEKRTQPQEFLLDARPQELRSVKISSPQDLTIYLREPGGYNPGMLAKKVELDGTEPWTWEQVKDSSNPFSGRKATLYVLNPTGAAAQLTVTGTTSVEYEQVSIIPTAAFALVGLVFVYLALRLALPKAMAVASATSKEAVAQPLFQVVLALGGFALIAFIFIPYNTFGEDVKMLKQSGLELMMVLGILVAAWTASVSVSEEIEGRTALTVLSKPIGRIQFILGKFFGIVQAVGLLFLFLGTLFLLTVSFKVVYDTRESALPEALWVDCYAELAGIVPGLILVFFETVIIAAISVAISTRLPMLPNLVICFSVYALGHLAPMLVQAKVNDPYGIIHFVGQFFATVLPVLENFTIQAPISAGIHVPLSYLAWALLYCVLYSTIAMLLALVLFEDRDLA